MSLVPMRQMLLDALEGSYAVCYCEAWNLESFQAVVQAAEETNAPIITGFNGGFLGHPCRRHPEALEYYAGLGLPLQSSTVPEAFLLNESDDFNQIERAIELGFNAVMVENEHLEMTAYLELVKRVVRLAHDSGVSVEVAIGRLADAPGKTKEQITDPAVARNFVDETGVDALGVAVGNIHILTRGKASIDLAKLEEIHAEVKVPLVLHGGTGISLEEIQSYVRQGVAKINFGTNLKQEYLAALRKKLLVYQEPMSPHRVVGMGGQEDILTAGREAVKNKVKELVTRCGAAGKASKALGKNVVRNT